MYERACTHYAFAIRLHVICLVEIQSTSDESDDMQSTSKVNVHDMYSL